MLILSSMASKTGMWGFFFLISFTLAHSFYFLGRVDGRWGEAEGSVPSFHQRCGVEDFCQRAELWKWNVRMADHRGQRKMIFSSLRLPQPGPLLWGLLLLTGNRSRRLLCFCSVPHTHTHVCTHVYTCSGVLCTHTYAHTQTLHHLSIP